MNLMEIVLKHIYFTTLLTFTTLSLIGCGSGGSDSPIVVEAVDEPTNSAPEITSTPITTASVDLTYSYTISVTDAENDTISFSASVLPAWLTLNASTGLLTGSPIDHEVGDHEVALVVSDGTNETSHSFTIAVTELPAVTAYQGYTGEYENLTLVIDERFDEFNGEQWIKSTHTFYEQGCILETEGVQYSAGIMSLVVDESENTKGYSCGEIRSVNRYGYGRIEARIKTPATEVASGYISSLFTYVFRPGGVNNDDTSASIRWRELDIEMEGAHPDSFQANYIYADDEWEWWRTRAWGAYEDNVEVGTTNEWKVYALE